MPCRTSMHDVNKCLVHSNHIALLKELLHHRNDPSTNLLTQTFLSHAEIGAVSEYAQMQP